MLSRVASNLYWLSRYIERSDGILRMLKINYAFAQDTLSEVSWRPIINIYTTLGEGQLSSMEFNNRAVLDFMVMDRNNQNSVVNIITQARENARSVQDHITKDLWQCLNEYYHLIKDAQISGQLQREDPISVLDGFIRQIMLYYGTAEVTMERGEGRSFMNIGKFLERGIQSLDVLDIKFGSINQNPDLLTDATYWKHLLLSLGGYEIYLKKYRTGLDAENVLEQVVLNHDFPRSVEYSVSNIDRYFEKLKNDSSIIEHKEMSLMIGRLKGHVKYSTVELIQQDGLHNFLSSTKQKLYEIGNALNRHYFAHA